MPTAQSSSPDKNLVMIALLLMLAGLGGTYQFLVPQLRQAKDQHAQLTALHEEKSKNVEILKEIQSKLTEGKADMAQRDINLVKLPNVVPVEEEMPQLYIEFERIALMHASMEMTYQIATPSKDEAGKVTVPVTVGATATYDELKYLIRFLHLHYRPLVLTSVILSDPPEVQSTDGKPADRSMEGKLVLSATGYIAAQDISPEYGPPPTEATAPIE
jgi:Tfp pilus assembly protein PilO